MMSPLRTVQFDLFLNFACRSLHVRFQTPVMVLPALPWNSARVSTIQSPTMQAAPSSMAGRTGPSTPEGSMLRAAAFATGIAILTSSTGSGTTGPDSCWLPAMMFA